MFFVCVESKKSRSLDLECSLRKIKYGAMEIRKFRNAYGLELIPASHEGIFTWNPCLGPHFRISCILKKGYAQFDLHSIPGCRLAERRMNGPLLEKKAGRRPSWMHIWLLEQWMWMWNLSMNCNTPKLERLPVILSPRSLASSSLETSW